MTKHLTTKQVAQIRRVSVRRIQAEIKQGHYPHAKRCECDQAWLIPERDIKNITNLGNNNAK